MYKICRNRNLLIGYHIEGGETFENVDCIPLSMETISNNRPLFICKDPFQWNCDYLNTPLRILEIGFLPHIKEFNTHLNEVYHSLFKWREMTKDYIYGDLVRNNSYINLFTLNEINDCNELQESFIVNPADWVKSIKVIR